MPFAEGREPGRAPYVRQRRRSWPHEPYLQKLWAFRPVRLTERERTELLRCPKGRDKPSGRPQEGWEGRERLGWNESMISAVRELAEEAAPTAGNPAHSGVQDMEDVEAIIEESALASPRTDIGAGVCRAVRS